MITGISIENFKGIGERIDLELKPLTLLFGANSAGKSTILHAMHYAREVFERHNLDADQTVAGGPFVDLGGFRNFAYMRDLDLPIRFSFRLDLQDTYLPYYGTPMHGEPEFEGYQNPSLAEVRRCEVHLEIAWSHQDAAPYVREYAVWLDDKWFGVIHKEAGHPGCTLRINLAHPSLLSTLSKGSAPWDWGPLGHGTWPVLASLFFQTDRRKPVSDSTLEFQHYKQPETVTVLLGGQKDALPRWEQKLSFDGNDGAGQQTANQYTWVVAGNQPALPYTSIGELLDAVAKGELEKSNALDIRGRINTIERVKWLDDFGWDPERETREWTIEEVSALLVGPGQLVRDALTGFRYLGPLRRRPAGTAPPRFPDPSRWASGLGAWDTLADAEEEFVNIVSHWLGDPERLNAGYNVHCKKFKELDVSEPWVRQLSTARSLDDMDSVRLSLEKLPTRSRIQILPSTDHGRSSQNAVELQPQDVGVGISQVVPVIVTALDGKGRLLAIEQPELHLHPRLQAELGDLFIQAAKGEAAHTLLLETHSEMIPLRIMRRIRNTTEGSLPPHVPPIASSDVAIYYVGLHNSATVVRELELDEEGQLLDPWPEGFFEEGFRERFGK